MCEIVSRQAMIVSLMADNNKESWHTLIKQVEDAGHDIELNFGCPHGMTEREMGAAVGQDPSDCPYGGGMGDEKSDHPGHHQTDAHVHSVVPTGKAVVEAGT